LIGRGWIDSFRPSSEVFSVRGVTRDAHRAFIVVVNVPSDSREYPILAAGTFAELMKSIIDRARNGD
jgi:hypothetical protein